MTSDRNGVDPQEGARKPRLRRRRPTENAVIAPTLGYIPSSSTSPTPTLSDPVSDATTAYVQAIDRIQAADGGARILLVTAPVAGNLPTHAALNLAIAATRIGLRSVVIDGDSKGRGPSRYLRTGSGPGLAELASGEAGLKEASRLIQVDADSRLPIIPAGTDAATDFAAAAIAEPINQITEHSDLVFIVTSAEASNERIAALGAHADGSLLIIDGSESQTLVGQVADRMASVGAPVTGIIELSRPKRSKGRGR